MASSRKRRKSDCEDHGVSTAWAICRHLRKGRRLDYHWIESEPPRLEADYVLCDSCAELLIAEDAWTSRFWDFADFRLYCEKCCKRETHERKHRLVCRGRLAPEPKQRRRK